MDHIKYHPLSFLCKQYIYDKEKETEKKLFAMWLVKYKNMDKDNFISFDEFLDMVKTPTSNRDTQDILKEVQEIREKITLQKEV